MMRIGRLLLMLAVSTVLLSACGGGGSSSTAAPAVDDGNAPVTITMEADYGQGRSIIPTLMTVCTDTTSDGPGFVAGTDCDGDGGVVAYADPSSFKVAIKRLALVMNDSTMVDLIADTGTLADSVVVDLDSPVQLAVSEIPQGTYTAFYAEFYYYDITMPLYSANQLLRVYLSDDDFPAEGSLGNHQGDIKLLDGSDVFGFVHAGVAWQDGLLDYVRPAVMGGASTADAETGHDRGLYGNDELWNGSAFMQGADQDIFVANDIISMTGVTIGSGGKDITISFDLADTWFFEDYNSNGIFEPCINDSEEGCGGEWTPVFPGISFSFSD